LIGMRVTDVHLDATVADHRKGPRADLPQVAFAGRSNVGKSSLLNVLLGTRLAGVSKQPGKTRTINYYRVNQACFFVDLPGYGFARAAQADRARWGARITDYLQHEPRLRLVVGLIDPRIPTSPLDVDLVRFVGAAQIPLLTVLTKSDKLGRGALAQAAARLTIELGLDAKPLSFSAQTGTGAKEILAAIAQALAE
jgi:GTP-binding protein